MKKVIYLIITVSYSSFGFGQTNPKDTVYYPAGDIRSILFKNDRASTGQPVTVYFRQFKIDSTFFGERIADTCWSFGTFETRYYYSNGIILRHSFYNTNREQHTLFIMNAYQKDTLLLVYTDVIFDFVKSTPSFRTTYTLDTTTGLVSIALIDSASWKKLDDLLFLPLNEGSQIAPNNIFPYGQHGSFSVEYEYKGLMRFLGYMNGEENGSSENWLMYFNRDQFIDSIRIYKNGLEGGEAIYYHHNSPIEAYKGNFIGRREGIERIGSWERWNEEGKLIMREIWENGLLKEKYEF